MAREKDAERRSFAAIQEFEADKKSFYRVYENRHLNKGWREEVTRIKQKVVNLKDRLINIEVELMEDAEALLKKEILLGIDDNNKQIQIILSEEQKDDKND